MDHNQKLWLLSFTFNSCMEPAGIIAAVELSANPSADVPILIIGIGTLVSLKLYKEIFDLIQGITIDDLHSQLEEEPKTQLIEPVESLLPNNPTELD